MHSWETGLNGPDQSNRAQLDWNILHSLLRECEYTGDASSAHAHFPKQFKWACSDLTWLLGTCMLFSFIFIRYFLCSFGAFYQCEYCSYLLIPGDVPEWLVKVAGVTFFNLSLVNLNLTPLKNTFIIVWIMYKSWKEKQNLGLKLSKSWPKPSHCLDSSVLGSGLRQGALCMYIGLIEEPLEAELIRNPSKKHISFDHSQSRLCSALLAVSLFTRLLCWRIMTKSSYSVNLLII